MDRPGPDRPRGLVHAYAITIAAAQGLTADRSHVLGRGADVHHLYAAMSRARDQVDLYLPAADLHTEEDLLRQGPVRDDRDHLARTLKAYTRTLAAQRRSWSPTIFPAPLRPPPPPIR
ncbi:hypothetical protein HUT17_05410 (plasmid) [Nocardiopsis flavescens]|nr:hypothetical protein HUT17_05410 [Nocardiopsis flavescens]